MAFAVFIRHEGEDIHSRMSIWFASEARARLSLERWKDSSPQALPILVQDRLIEGEQT